MCFFFNFILGSFAFLGLQPRARFKIKIHIDMGVGRVKKMAVYLVKVGIVILRMCEEKESLDRD